MGNSGVRWSILSAQDLVGVWTQRKRHKFCLEDKSKPRKSFSGKFAQRKKERDGGVGKSFSSEQSNTWRVFKEGERERETEAERLSNFLPRVGICNGTNIFRENKERESS